MIRHLYFHLPFCARRCPYCGFVVDTRLARKGPPFIAAVLAEVDRRRAEFAVAPATVYFGGGTPTALSLRELELLIGGVRDRFGGGGGSGEWTIEANPATVSPAKAALLVALGITRVSLGVQSWDDGALRALGRQHTAAQARRTYGALRAAGCDNVNVDLMFGVPGQGAASWRETLAVTVGLAPEHVSAYCLSYDDGTEFRRRLDAGLLRRATEDGEAAHFTMARDALGAAGYRHYEVSNYARPGRESAHNAAYWAGADYLGFGPGAFSTVGDRRWQNHAATGDYLATVRAAAGPAAGPAEILTPAMRRTERLGLGLRTADGVPLAVVGDRPEPLREVEAAGLAERRDGRLRLTAAGLLVADEVAALLV